MKYSWSDAYKKAFESHYKAGEEVSTIDSFHELIFEAANFISDYIRSNPLNTEKVSLHFLNEFTQDICKQFIKSDHLEAGISGEVFGLKKSLDLFRKLFCEGGPFAGVQITMPAEYEPGIAQISPLIHLCIKEPENFSVVGGMPQFLVKLELLRPSQIAKMRNQLTILDGIEPNTSFEEIMIDVRSNIHSMALDNDQLSCVERRGGLEYLLRYGADVRTILNRCDYSVSSHMYSGETVEPFTQIFKLTHDCLAYLEGQDEITASEALAIQQRLFTMTICHAGLSSDKQQFDWTSMIKTAYTEGVEKDLDGVLFLTYLCHTPAAEINQEVVQQKVSTSLPRLKKEMDACCDNQVLNDLVSKLGIEHLYSTNELLIMRGHQFSGDLGL